MATVTFSHESTPLEAHSSDKEPSNWSVAPLAGIAKLPKRLRTALAALAVFSVAAGVGAGLLEARRGLSLADASNRKTLESPQVASAPAATDPAGSLFLLPPTPHEATSGDSTLAHSAAATQQGREALARFGKDLEFCRNIRNSSRRLLHGFLTRGINRPDCL
eukprot:GHVT01012415.1.p1 GENE.GHVT01012415.1~~GHVT01012415.1.p1  ORF type:complete len:163 (-),score=30.27 GHVT01012415.1:1046-1534(-)